MSDLSALLGSTADEPDVSGTITVPEVAHDTEEDEYVVSAEQTQHIHLPVSHMFVV